MFQCSDLSRCLTGDQHCDNRSQCADSSDEHNCCKLSTVLYYVYTFYCVCSSVFMLPCLYMVSKWRYDYVYGVSVITKLFIPLSYTQMHVHTAHTQVNTHIQLQLIWLHDENIILTFIVL